MDNILPILQENKERDDYFGLTTEQLKTPPLHEFHELYEGLSSDALNTPYRDWREIGKMCQQLGIGQLVDVGCGNGRSLFCLPDDIQVIGIEVHSKKAQAIRKGLKKHNRASTFIQADLKEMNLPLAQAYFFYFPCGETLDRLLYQIYRQRERKLWIIAIESHGDLIELLEQQNWLTLKEKIPCSLPRHNNCIYFFQSHPEALSNNTLPTRLLKLSGQKGEQQLLIEQNREFWLADPLGLDRAFTPKLYCQFPRGRYFFANQIKGILYPRGLLKKAVIERRKNSRIKKIILTHEGALLEVDYGKKVSLSSYFKN